MSLSLLSWVVALVVVALYGVGLALAVPDGAWSALVFPCLVGCAATAGLADGDPAGAFGVGPLTAARRACAALLRRSA